MNILRAAIIEAYQFGNQNDDLNQLSPTEFEVSTILSNVQVMVPDELHQLRLLRKWLMLRKEEAAAAGQRELHASVGCRVGTAAYTAYRSRSTALQHEALLLDSFIAALDQVQP